MTGAATSRGAPPARRWAVPYRPLRPASLLAQLAVLAAAEVVLFASYAGHDSRFHWAAHFLVGLIAAAAWLSAYLLIAGRPSPGQILAVLWFHLVAMAPDLLYLAGVAHYHWMDVFLGHVAVHYIPGGDTTWLVLAVGALAAYAWLLFRWLGARHSEAERGMAPGIGIGGDAVIRAQRDPREHDLAHWHSPADRPLPGAATRSEPAPLLLLHGLGGTASTWAAVAQRLAAAGVPTLRVDLLGHGDSGDIGTRFTLAHQVQALTRLLDDHDLARIRIAAHSWGCAVAAAFAQRYPERVEQLLLVAPPAFDNPEVARARLGSGSWLARRTLAGAPVADLVCGLMCLSRGLLGRIAGRVRPDLDEAIARGGVEHTYPAYRDGLDALVVANPLPAALRTPRHPTAVLLGADDELVRGQDIHAIGPDEGVTVTTVPGGHDLPFGDPATVTRFLLLPPRSEECAP